MAEKLPDDGPKMEFPDLPEMSEVDIGFWESAIPNLMMGLTVDPVEKARVIQTQFKDDDRLGEVGVDKFGNPVITWKGERFYVNKPGLSMTDATDLVAQGTQLLPAAKYAGGGLSLVGKGVRGLMSYGATSAAQQQGVRAAGGKQYVDPTQMGVEAATGAVTEMAMPVVGKYVLDPVMDPITKRFIDPAIDAVKGAFTSQTAKAVEKDAVDEVIDAALNKLGEAESKYPLTQGQRSRDPKQLAREDLLRNTPESAGSAQVRNFDQRQLDAIREDASKLQPGKTGFGDDAMPDVGQELQGRLVSRARALKNRGDAVYKAAEKASKERPAIFTPASLDDMYGRMLGVIDEMGIEPEQLAQMSNLKRATDALRTRMSNLDADPSSLTFDRLEGLRKSLWVDYGNAAPKSPEAKAVRDMIDRMDASVDDAITSGLVSGDPATVEIIKKARSAWNRYKSFTGGKRTDPSTVIMEKLVDPTRSTPEELVRAIFGVSKIDNSARARNLVRRIVNEFGKDSPEVAKLKDAFLYRTFVNTKGELSREAILRNVRKNILQTRSIAGALFSDKELGSILELARNVAPTVEAEIRRNNSASAYTIIGAFLDKYGALTGPIRDIFKTFKDIRDAQRATYDAPVLKSRPGLSAPAAGVGAPMIEENMQ